MGTLSKALLCLLLLYCVSASAAATGGYLKYKDPKQPLGARIRDLMNRMTLQEKIGQTVQIERTVATPQVMKKYFIGKKRLSNDLPLLKVFDLLCLTL